VNRSVTRALVAVVSLLVLPSCGGRSGVCGTPEARHCHGVVQWDRPAPSLPLTGAYTTIDTVRMSPGDGYFVTNEIWLRQTTPCGREFRSLGCWVEAGQIGLHGQNPAFFWAEQKPDGAVDFHILGEVLPRAFGGFSIYSINRVGPDIHISVLSADRSGNLLVSFAQRSERNSMVPDAVTVGQEFTGTTDRANVERAEFWLTGIVRGEGLDSSLMTDDGNITLTAVGEPGTFRPGPIRARWRYPPTSGKAGGGIFVTDCCS
jgi:hypothetical protein